MSQNFMDMNYEGFARATQETLEYLTKAMTAGSGVDAAAFTGGRALTLESLDQTLVNILWSQDEAKLFQLLKKQAIKSPVHQFDKRTGVGAGDGAWVAEGGDSIEADQSIARAYVTAKYLQTKRVVTLQATLSNMIEDAIALEKNAGTLWLIQQVEKALFYGNSANVAEEPDGLIAQIPASNIIDVRGADATSSTFEDKLNEGARTIRNNYGKASHLIGSTMMMNDVQKLIRDRVRFGDGQNGFGSGIFSKYPTPFGNFDIVDDIFITEGTTPVASSLTSLRPGTITIGSITTPADAASEFVTADAGDYWYKIVPVNKYGDGVAVATSAAETVAAGDKVVIPITNGSPAATAYKVYRSKKGAVDASDCRYAFTTAVTGSPMNIIDYNSYLPGCSDAFLLNLNTTYDAIEFAQFLPMLKFDLYPTAACTFPFLLMLFGCLAVKKTSQHIRIKNLSASNMAWF